MDRLHIALLTIVLIFACCNGEPPIPPPDPEPEYCSIWEEKTPDCECPDGSEFVALLNSCVPPRVDKLIDFSQVNGGVTAFSLVLRDMKYIVQFSQHVLDHWTLPERGQVVLRVGAQVAGGWCDSGSAGYLPCGPAYGTREADDNLLRLLEVTSRIPNVYLQIIPTFTYKHIDKGSPAENIKYFNGMFNHANSIVQLGDYKHVVWEMFNEVVHPISQHIKDEDVLLMMQHANRNTPYPMGTDYHGGGEGDDWKGRYPYIWRDVVGYIAFHTPRNPEPSFAIMKKAEDKYKYLQPDSVYGIEEVWIDETICWASDENISKHNLKGKGTIALQGYGTEDERMSQVVKHLRDIHKLGWKPFYHAIWLIECAEIGRIPTYSTDIAR